MEKVQIASEKTIGPSEKRSWVPKAHPISWWMLLVTTLAMLLCSIDRQILPTVLPAIMKDFNLNSVEAGFLNSLNFVGSFIGAILVGVLADSLGGGHRRAWSWMGTCIITAVAGIATFFSKGIASLQLWRFIMGFGTGSMEPVNVALVSDFWHKENRGFAIGTHHTGLPIGQFVGPVLIGAILAVGTWKSTFLWIPILGIFIMLIQVFVGTRRNEQRVYKWIKERNLTLPRDVNAEVTKNPFKNAFEAIKNRNVMLGMTINFLFLWTEMGTATFLTLQLTDSVGISLAKAAVISGASGITGWIGQIVWGTVSDHLGRKFSLSILAIGSAFSVLGCIFIHSVTFAWIILIVWGIFRNSPYPVVFSLAVDSSPKSAGAGLGILIGVSLGLSGALVTTVAGYFIDHFGWTWNYIMLSAVSILALIPIYLIRETAGQKA
ncbi:UNVERIFIED_ORG: MFS family permease [Heyndrickxia coagulans]